MIYSKLLKKNRKLQKKLVSANKIIRRQAYKIKQMELDFAQQVSEILRKN